jgi:methyl-accepting chemotaxis protein
MFEHLRVISQAIGEELGTLRERLAAPLAAAIDLSEREVLAAGRAAYGILGEAKGHVSDLRAVLDDFTRATSAGSHAIANVIRAQSAMFTGYAAQLGDLAHTSEKAVDLTRNIVTLGREVEKISSALRLLTLNAQMESARFGADGKTFGVIANEMRALSLEAQKASLAIGNIAEDLAVAMPQIKEQSGQLLASSATLSQELTRQVQDFEKVHRETQRSLLDAIHRSGVKAEKLADHAADLINHLQFQDRIAQGLGAVGDVARHSEEVVKTLVSALERGDVEFDVAAAREKTRAAAAVALVRMDDNSGGGVANGEVDFF